MNATVHLAGLRLAPALRYRNVAAAVDWLCAAFGFEKHAVIAGTNGDVVYAELAFGNAVVMLGPVCGSALDKLMKQPDEVGGAETQSCYLIVNDADAHYVRAVAAGAEIVLDIKSDDYGGRSYSCRDPEGHLWTFGTYDPWRGRFVATNLVAAKEDAAADFGVRSGAVAGDQARAAPAGTPVEVSAVSVATGAAAEELPPPIPRTARRIARGYVPLAGLFAVAIVSVLAAASLDGLARREAESAALLAARQQLALEQGARGAAERAARAVRGELLREQNFREAAERAAKHLEEQLAQEREAKEVAQSAANSLREALTLQRGAAERAAPAGKAPAKAPAAGAN
jgi:uncharacterized glyoxalase superfamily protein PhnB